jgi:uncharacterized membrane protein YccF (DUF307 family)
MRSVLNLVLNLIWLVFAGIWAFLGWLLAALIMFILIITIPFGVQAVKIAVFSLWPFGRTLVKREEAGAPSAVGNVLWLVLCGWWLAILHLASAVAQALTIIGIPLALGSLKLIPISLWPFGREIVSIEEARARGELASGVAIGERPEPAG